MKHARQDYNRIQDPTGQIPYNEPVFLLRGQDVCAPFAIQAWAEEAEKRDADPEIITSARLWAVEMLAYQQKVKRKTPDQPPRIEADCEGIPENDPNADITNINMGTREGQLLMAAIGLITGSYQTNKTPFEIMDQLLNLQKQMYKHAVVLTWDYNPGKVVTSEGVQCVKCGNWYSKDQVCAACFIDEGGPNQNYPHE